MKKKFILFISTIILSLLFQVIGFADSPVTSTNFYTAYLNVDIVKKAEQSRVINEEIAQYLSNPNNPIDVKAATINALGWDFDGKTNAEKYVNIIYKKSLNELDLDSMDGDSLFCIGYLTALDDYFNPLKALPILEKANLKIKDSLTVSVITSIVKGQVAMDDLGSWYKVGRLTENVVNNKSLKQDMRPEAIKIITDYMYLYNDNIGIEPTKINVVVEVGENATANIIGGNPPYKVDSIRIIDGPAQVETSIYENLITFKGLQTGTIIVNISDKDNNTIEIPVYIVNKTID